MSARRFHLAALVVVLVIAGGLSFYASTEPDGLERVAADHGIETAAEDGEARDGPDGPLDDYRLSGVDDDRISVGLSGVIGVAVVGLVAWCALWALRRGDGGGESDDRGTAPRGP